MNHCHCSEPEFELDVGSWAGACALVAGTSSASLKDTRNLCLFFEFLVNSWSHVLQLAQCENCPEPCA